MVLGSPSKKLPFKVFPRRNLLVATSIYFIFFFFSMVDCITLHVIAKVCSSSVRAGSKCFVFFNIDFNRHSSSRNKSRLKCLANESLSVICTFGDSSHLCAIFKLQKHQTRKVRSHYLEECSYLKRGRRFFIWDSTLGDSTS